MLSDDYDSNREFTEINMVEIKLRDTCRCCADEHTEHLPQ